MHPAPARPSLPLGRVYVQLAKPRGRVAPEFRRQKFDRSKRVRYVVICPSPHLRRDIVPTLKRAKWAKPRRAAR